MDAATPDSRDNSVYFRAWGPDVGFGQTIDLRDVEEFARRARRVGCVQAEAYVVPGYNLWQRYF